MLLGLAASAPVACISGGGIGGGGDLGGGPPGGPSIASLPPPAGGSGNQNAPTMPDIAVGPVYDVSNDPNKVRGPNYGWRIYGTATAVCRSTETESVTPLQLNPSAPSTFPPHLSMIRGIVLGKAQAAAGEENDIQVSASNVTVHRLKVSIKGQVQFNVDGGEFFNWDPAAFPGDHVIRALDPYNNVVDTKIKEGGVIELSFLLRLSGEPSLATFLSAMQGLHFLRTPDDFPTGNLDVQKTCSNEGLWLTCKSYLSHLLWDMKEMAPSQPDYGGTTTDFPGLPECPPAS